MSACVACETAMGDNQESVTTGQTDIQTDAGQSYPFCAAMVRRRHKKHHINQIQSVSYL